MTKSPPSAPPPTPQELQSEFDMLGAYLDAVIQTVTGGHMPDMAGLDKRMTTLCARVEKAEPELQQACLTSLKSLLSRLDTCEAQIRAYHDKAANGATGG